LRSSLLFLSFLVQSENAAEDVNLIFVNGNIYIVKRAQAARRSDRGQNISGSFL
jgi:hypothetical protein